MENEDNKRESWPAGRPRRIILDLLRKEEKEWKSYETPPTKENPIRTILFTKNEEWRFFDEE